MERALPLAAALVLAGCTGPGSGLLPVGGGSASPIEIERFVRRAHLDLTGAAPTAGDLAAARTELIAAGNTAAARGALVNRLMDTPAFSAAFVAELENRVFAGEAIDGRYQILCNAVRNFDAACRSCPPPAGGDQCSCACPLLQAMTAERASLAASPADLAAGRSTQEIERRYGGAYVFKFSFGDPAARATALFTTFLGRDPGPDELRNATVLANDVNDPNVKALLFHRLGLGWAGLVDIVFTSEAYGEAAVGAAFLRYLGRSPSPVELAVWSAKLDAAHPDVRPVIRALVSSREYFTQ